MFLYGGSDMFDSRVWWQILQLFLECLFVKSLNHSLPHWNFGPKSIKEVWKDEWFLWTSKNTLQQPRSIKDAAILQK